VGETTGISWTDATFNPWIGCAKVAPGCANCYAEADIDNRRGRVKWGPHGTRSRTSDAYWREPIKWNRDAACNCHARPDLRETHLPSCPQSARPRVFCASLADVFEDWSGPILDSKGLTLHHGSYWQSKDRYVSRDMRIGVSTIRMSDLRNDLFDLIDKTPNLDWLLLTKRPENVLSMWPTVDDCGIRWHKKRPNVWLGTSISDQATADKAIPHLLACRDLAPVLFLSAEPLLGPIDLTRVGNHDGTCANLFDGNCLYVGDIGGAEYAWSPRNFIQWLIVGGESGPQARPCDLAWIRSLREQSKAAGVACFVKQLGPKPYWNGNHPECNQALPVEHTPAEKAAFIDAMGEYFDHIHGWPVKDKKGGDPAEWPEDLRVREFPRIEVSE
jgi:protein gp37